MEPSKSTIIKADQPELRTSRRQKNMIRAIEQMRELILLVDPLILQNGGELSLTDFDGLENGQKLLLSIKNSVSLAVLPNGSS